MKYLSLFTCQTGAIRKLSLLLLTLFICNNSLDAQILRRKNKLIQFNGDYTHTETGVSIPQRINDFTLDKITFSDEDYTVYDFEYKPSKGVAGISARILLYSKEEAPIYSGRLNREYIKGLLLITSQFPGGKITHSLLRHEGDDYICNGRKGDYLVRDRHYHVIVYECGKWVFCILSSSRNENINKLEAFENEAVKLINLSAITASAPLTFKPFNIHFDDEAFADSTALLCNMGAAYGELEWMIDNIEEKELASGYPDLYLEAKINAVHAALKADRENKLSRDPETQTYLDGLYALESKGFLPEFIMEENDMMMYYSDNFKFNFEAFHQWKEQHLKNFKLSWSYSIVLSEQ